MSRLLNVGSVLPLIIFPTLSALAIHFTFGHFLGSGSMTKIVTQCQPNFLPPPDSVQKSYFTPYTGITIFDQELCPLVAFFDILIGSNDTLPFVAYAIGISLPLVVLPVVEAYRSGQSRLLSYPAVWGLLTQVATVGVIFPLYWLVFILTGGVKKSNVFGPRSFTQAEAQAIIFGIVVGSIIPSVAMLTMNDYHLTAIWQFYPLLVSISQMGHLQWRPKSTHPQSGYGIMQTLYLGCFMMSSSVHIATVWPIMTDFAAVRALLLPSISPLPLSTDITLHLLDFLKWDIVFAYSSTALAMLWFARNFKQILLIVLWYTFAVPSLGCGAAIMGVAIWKDGIME